MSSHLKRNQRTQSLFKQLIDGLLVAFPFIDLFLFRYSFILFPGPLGYGPLICMYMLLPIWMVRYAFPTRLVLALVTIALMGGSGVLTGIVSTFDFFKVWGGLVLSSTYYWYLWHHLRKDYIRGFQLYANGCVIVSIFGLLIFVDAIVPFGFHSFANSIINVAHVKGELGIRVASTFGEPTYFATAVAPSSVFALRSVFAVGYNENHPEVQLNKWQSLTILIALALSFSTVAFVGIAIAAAMLFFRAKSTKSRIGLIVASLILSWSALQTNDIAARVNSFRLDNIAIADMHGSSAILYNHFHIATQQAKETPLFGGGLCSHPSATERFSILRGTYLDVIYNKNNQDASSMFLRLLSEFGLFGVLGLFSFLFIYRPSTRHHYFREIAWACFISIVLQLFRQGNFVLHGFPFFLTAYALLPCREDNHTIL